MPAASHRDRGAVAVEAALVLPLLLLVLLATVEAALWLRDTTTVSAATRHGARIASAEPRRSSMATDAAAAVASVARTLPAGAIEELWIYQADARGFPLGVGSLASCPSRCLRFGWVPTAGAFRQIGGTWAPSLVNACPADPLAMSVGVALHTRHQVAVSSIVGGTGTRKIAERSVLRFEPMPARSCGVGVR